MIKGVPTQINVLVHLFDVTLLEMSNKPVFTPKNISYLSTYSYQCNLSKLITYVNNASPACLDNC